MTGGPGDPLEEFLPLRGLVADFELLSGTSLPFAHGLVAGAFLRTPLAAPGETARFLVPHAVESGRSRYRRGDRYRFGVVARPEAHDLLEQLTTWLAGLPARPSATPQRGLGPAMLRCHDLWDLFGAAALPDEVGRGGYGAADLEEEAARWRGVDELRVRLLSPLRILRPKAERRGARDQHFCRLAVDLTAELLLRRLRGSFALPEQFTSDVRLEVEDVFWVEQASRRSASQRGELRDDPPGHHAMRSIGGLLGSFRLAGAGALDEDTRRALVLAQYVGMGQSRAWGMGRIALEDREGSRSSVSVVRATSLLEAATHPGAMRSAWRHVVERRRARQRRSGRAHPRAGLDPKAEELAVPDELDALAERVLDGGYSPDSASRYELERPDGSVRVLEVPDSWDRVAQRAALEVMTPVLEAVFHDTSFGFRRGRSRYDAARELLNLMEAGRPWVLRADIARCFESISLHRVARRLETLFDRDPIVDQVLRWLRVRSRDPRSNPAEGLPEGAPLSPSIANLMLTDLDEAMLRAGWVLLRFADDLAVPCTSQRAASAALRDLTRELARLQLSLATDKTRVDTLDGGVAFLGFELSRAGIFESRADRTRQVPARRAAAAQRPAGLAEELRAADDDTNRNGEAATASHTAPDTVASSPRPPGDDAPVPELDADGALPVICIFGEPATVRTRAGRVEVVRGADVVESRPWRSVAAVALFGRQHGVTSPALHAALSAGVPVYFALASGRYVGVAWHGRPGQHGFGLWTEQMRCFEDEERALVPARAVAARIRHQREVLRQASSTSREGDMPAVLRELAGCVARVESAATPSELLVLEGRAAALYFAEIRERLPRELGFSARNRRPPRDPFNALLSLGYTFLYLHVETLIHASGLAPQVGFLHTSRGRHAGLASDMMEPFRHLVERVALRTALRVQDLDRRFNVDDEGRCLMDDSLKRSYSRSLLLAFAKPRTAYGDDRPRGFHHAVTRQALSLVRYIRDPAAGFEAWRTR